MVQINKDKIHSSRFPRAGLKIATIKSHTFDIYQWNHALLHVANGMLGDCEITSALFAERSLFMELYAAHRIAALTIAVLAAQLSCSAKAQQTPPMGFHITSQSMVEDLSAPLGVSASGMPRPLVPLALFMIKDFEGWAPSYYDDPAGYCTIGYGHLIALKRCAHISLGKFANRLSVAEGDELLELDTRSARRAVQKLVSPELTDEQYGALASFAFNVGKQKFAESTMLALLNMKEFNAASKEFRRWIKAKGEVFDGLVDRRKCEEALFNKVLKLDKDGKFSRHQCQSFGAAPTENLIDIEIGEQRKGAK